MRARWILVASCVACGRLNFDVQSSGDARRDDANGDASALCTPGTTCRAAVGPCDLPATCDPASLCPPNPFAAPGVSCSGTSVCTGDDSRCPTWQTETSGTTGVVYGVVA